MISNNFLDFTSEMSRGIAIDFGVEFALDLPHILPGKNSKTPTLKNRPQKWPPATPYARKSPQSLPYGASSLPNRRNPYLTRIFLDVCASKSSRFPPYAAARNFCTLKIFYMPACSIFGAPKFSTCDMKNFKARPIELFGRVGTPHIL